MLDGPETSEDKVVCESQAKRARWLQFVLVLLVDIAVAWGITKVLDETLIVGVAVFLGLQALSIFITLLRTLVDWGYYSFVGKRQGIALYESLLVQLKLPSAHARETSPVAYLEGISADSSCSTQTRINAAMFAGWLTGFKNCQGLWAKVGIDIMLEDAIVLHSRNAPEGRSVNS